jgi:hypothetical protein
MYMGNNNHVAYAFVQNFDSHSKLLQFENFRLCRIVQGDFRRLAWAKGVFGDSRLGFDWIYERIYGHVPRADPRTRIGFGDLPGLGDIPFQIEDDLLLLRLYQPGDITFSHVAVRRPSGEYSRQDPYRVTAYYPSSHTYRMEQADCTKWDRFAFDLSTHPNWGSQWFKSARRFFLYGCSKQFSPWLYHQDPDPAYLDRVMDFVAALEAALVPERDFVSRRLRERGARLLEGHAQHLGLEPKAVSQILNKFYSVRSAIAHGDVLRPQDLKTLDSQTLFENIVRTILATAVLQLPVKDEERKEFLRRLYDLSDKERGDDIIEKFKAIHDNDERARVLRKIERTSL